MSSCIVLFIGYDILFVRHVAGCACQDLGK